MSWLEAGLSCCGKESKLQEEQLLQVRQQVNLYFRKRCPPQEVDDLVQECLYRVLLAEARGLDLAPELVYHICHAVWVDYLRQQRRRGEMEEAMEEECVCLSWEQQLVLSIDIEACLRTLTPAERELLRRHHIDGETCASIGAHLGVSEQAVKKRLQRLKRRLRQLLADYGGGT
ncbi:MAG: sigma-70 family RNA polymerase sigma factor [Armatimonadota bacterium]|nr:sigma-70 family RNA polymerase sigma factor [bacterium]MDW8290540.1 sigma-70 family RNA polymerase sigma factor [Armatimonadota bacterium]